jgi:hypothetical protein
LISKQEAESVIRYLERLSGGLKFKTVLFDSSEVDPNTKSHILVSKLLEKMKKNDQLDKMEG